MSKKCLILILVFILGITVFSNPLHAQVRDSDIILNINPEFPTENQNVNAVLTSYVIDLNKAYITWSVNNEKMNAGIGKTSFSFNMVSNGNQIELMATINTAEGQSTVKTKTLSSGNIDMLWQAVDSYTPPFYKGKALVPNEGRFKVVAIPNINTQNLNTSLNNYSFSWEKDGDLQPSFSGWGKNSFTFKNSYLDRGNKVTVSMSDVTGKLSKKSDISLNTTTPKIIFYEKSPLLGMITEESLKEGHLVNKNGTTIVAIPYFISPSNLNSNLLSYKWLISDSEISTPDPKNEISIKPNSNSSGVASIRLSIENINTLYSNVGKQINVSF